MENTGSASYQAIDKLAEAIHYICSKATGEPAILDGIKLNKVLWFADASAYLDTGESITGCTYIRKPFGPVASQNLKAMEVLAEKVAMMPGKEPSHTGYWDTVFDVLEPYKPNYLMTKDRRTIDRVYDAVVVGHSTRSVSERTHGEIWNLAEEDEPLPLFTVFAESAEKPTEAQLIAAARR